MRNEVTNVFRAPEAGFLKAANARAALEHFVEGAGRHYNLEKRFEHARQEAKPSEDHHSRYIQRKPLHPSDWHGRSPTPGEGRHRHSFPRVGRGGIPNEIPEQHVDERYTKARHRNEEWHFAAGDGIADGPRMLRPFGLL